LSATSAARLAESCYRDHAECGEGTLRLEGPLDEIHNTEELKAWLQSQPSDVAIAFAARAALRVLPFVQEALRYNPNHIVLPVFRALAFAWSAPGYSIPTKGYAAPPIDVGAFGLASSAATSAGVAAQAARVTAERQWHSSMCPITCGCAALGDADALSTRNSRLHQAK
jgi:hypothetical protein